MASLKLQVIMLWIAVTFYVLATCLSIVGIVFKKQQLLQVSPWFGLVGFFPHTAAIILRWMQTGHFPYWGKYEVYNSYAWGVVILYLLVMALKSELKMAGIIFFPVAFFMTGMALTGSTEVKEIPGSFLTYWLGIHVFFAKLAYGSGLVSAFLGIVYLIRTGQGKTGKSFPHWLPSPETADYYAYRFAVLAFVCLSIMIGAGAVWAFKAWGRYWGWDPVETWSLVCWFIYGTILHLRVTMGWRGRKAAWLYILAVVVIVFSYFGMPILYDTVHEHLTG